MSHEHLQLTCSDPRVGLRSPFLRRVSAIAWTKDGLGVSPHRGGVCLPNQIIDLNHEINILLDSFDIIGSASGDDFVVSVSGALRVRLETASMADPA